MIGLIQGNLSHKQFPYIVVLAGGVGYEIFTHMRFFESLPKCDTEVSVIVHQHQKDAATDLYGFCDRSERALFRRLIDVSGTGPKLGMKILSSMEGAQIIRAIKEKNEAMLCTVPGVGARIAKRLIAELQDRLADLSTSESAESQTRMEVQHILLTLGYQLREIQAVLQKMTIEEDTEKSVREALKLLSGS